MLAISWATKRLLMAEIGNEAGDSGNSRDGRSSPGGVTPTTLESALDSVSQGYEPYAGFPAEFVIEELKLLIRLHGPTFPADELLTDRDWKAHARCDGTGPGEPPLTLQVDDDVADFLRRMADQNGIDLDRFANGLLEQAVLAEGGVGRMILNRSQTIGGHDFDTGQEVQADPVPGDFAGRKVTAKAGRKSFTGQVALCDLTKPEHYRQDRESLLQRVRKALAGLDVGVHLLSSHAADPANTEPANMVRVACNDGDKDTLAEVNRRLKAAGLIAYTQGRTVLHVRA